MPISTDVSLQQASPSPDLSSRWPRPPLCPRWIVWTPWAAIASALSYGSVRVWWAIHGTPWFGPRHTDLIFVTGWGAVALCGAASAVALALRFVRWYVPLLIAGWMVCIAALAACPLLLLDTAGGLLPGLGVQFYPAAFLSRASCFAMGILVGATTIAYRRRWRSACMFCGRTTSRAPRTETPCWAWWAAYLAVCGCLARLGAQIAVGFGMIQRQSGTRLAIESFLFEAAFLLAGIVLPLSLVHQWARSVPQWIPFLTGRRIPRWLPLGPAIVIGPLMTVYFAFTLEVIASITISGTTHQNFGHFPAAFFWVAVPAYLLWGIGLTAAAISYLQFTRPICKVCGRK